MATLKPVVSDLRDVPAQLREFYVERNGQFYLAVDGMVAKERLDEFRSNNIRLAKRIERLTGISPNRLSGL